MVLAIAEIFDSASGAANDTVASTSPSSFFTTWQDWHFLNAFSPLAASPVAVRSGPWLSANAGAASNMANAPLMARVFMWMSPLLLVQTDISGTGMVNPTRRDRLPIRDKALVSCC